MDKSRILLHLKDFLNFYSNLQVSRKFSSVKQKTNFITCFSSLVMAPPSVGGAAIPSAAAITSSAAAAAQFSTMPSGSGASSGATAAQVQAHIQAQAAAAAAAQQAASAQAAAAAAQAAAAQAAASQLTSSSVSFEPYTTRVWCYNNSSHYLSLENWSPIKCYLTCSHLLPAGLV